MTIWALEWLRFVRTRRVVAMVAFFVFFGLLDPLLVRFQDRIVENVGDGITVNFPPVTPPDGLAGFADSAGQLGFFLIVVVASGALTIQSNYQMNVFVRTRVSHTRDYVVPKVVIATAVAMGTFTLGAALAWMQSHVLLGALPPVDVMVGMGLTSLFFASVVGFTAVVGAITRSVIQTVLGVIGVTIVLTVAAAVGDLGDYLPSALVGALAGIATGQSPGDYLAPAVVAVVIWAGAIPISSWLAGRREVRSA